MESWELTPEQLASLSGENQQKYVRAARLKDFKEAQYWSEGNQILKRMGWTEREWFEGNEVWSRLYPPACLNHLLETTKPSTAWHDPAVKLPPMLTPVLIRLKTGKLIVAKLHAFDLEKDSFRFECDRYAYYEYDVVAWCHIPK
jgi:hypothetical protein